MTHFLGLATATTPVAPTVSITSPVANATISGTQTITATAASSGSSVAGVQFKVDGINVGPEDVSAPYEASWDTTTTANGTHTITATARSNNGLSTTSSPISVTVNNQVTPPIDNENIVANPSVEIIDPANNLKPSNWLSNKWGANTATFNYDQTGRTGNRSITTQMTSHTDGDAKWYFEPVNVVGNKSYLFRDYYKSTVPTRIVVASIDANGAYTYIEQPSAPIATSWSQYQTTFTVPSNAVKATVFHLIDQVGSLSIDDAYMQVATPIVPTPDSTVPNGSLEIGSASPSNWQSSSWGTNTPSFQYITNDGHTGSKSVKVSVSNYSSGDAKWFFDPIKTLTPGKQYRFNAWYKTNVIPHPVAMFIRADGTEQYFGMPAAQPNGTANWQQYSDTFSVPADAVSVSVFMYINQNGYLQTDDYSIAPYQPTGFSRPLLTMTFDDGHEDNVNTALPLLNQYGFKTTQCYATTFIEGNSQAVADILKFKNSGHEICSHTVTHPFLTTLDTATLNYELQHSKQYLESIIGQPVLNFASPYGDYNASVNNEIDNYYQSHRTVDEGYNSKDNLDVYRLRVQNVLDTTSANQIKIWIEQAKADNTWLILVYHRVASNPGPYDSYTNVFAQHLEIIQTSGITVKTYQDALTEIRSQ
jgi:peptidoglycan/xylan/chitin deacetylase (PgdA/CDA1 family)